MISKNSSHLKNWQSCLENRRSFWLCWKPYLRFVEYWKKYCDAI